MNRNSVGTRNITLPSGTAIEFYGAKAYRKPYANVIFIGQNGGYSDTNDLINQINKMIRYSNSENALIIGLTSGTEASRSALESAFVK